MDDWKAIRVTRIQKGEHVKVENPTSCKMIGSGRQGAVFQLSPERCVKIFGSPQDASNEARALKSVQGLPFAPKLYETGRNYIILEYLKGPNLKQYLQEKGTLPESVTNQILSILKHMKGLNFKRVDTGSLNHIIVNADGTLQMIDYASAYKPRSVPVWLLRDMAKLGMLDILLDQVKKIEPPLYLEWVNALETHKDKILR